MFPSYLGSLPLCHLHQSRRGKDTSPRDGSADEPRQLLSDILTQLLPNLGGPPCLCETSCQRAS
jgi:hypothetical protein